MRRGTVREYLQRPYARVLVPDDDGTYAAQVLEFPGCYSQGDTPKEAYQNLEEAAENWIESALAQDFPIPPPFANQGYSGTISLRLPKSLHRRAAAFAQRDGVSLNQFLVTAIAARLGAEDLLAAMISRAGTGSDVVDLMTALRNSAATNRAGKSAASTRRKARSA